MTTIAHPGALAKHIARVKRATHAAHRPARGAQRRRTPEQRARDIAVQVALRQDEGRTWCWSDYGIVDNIVMRGLVEAARAALR